METYITLIASSLISSVIGAIVGAVVSTIKVLRTRSADEKHAAENMKELMTQNVLMTCRLVIYSDKFSVDEKLDSYKIYRDHGGNHQTKTYMDNLVGSDVDEYLEKHGR